MQILVVREDNKIREPIEKEKKVTIKRRLSDEICIQSNTVENVKEENRWGEKI
jgi:hypothetical protein